MSTRSSRSKRVGAGAELVGGLESLPPKPKRKKIEKKQPEQKEKTPAEEYGDWNGQYFVLVGGFKMGKFAAGEAIAKYGGILKDNVTKSMTDIVIGGAPVDSGYGPQGGLKGAKCKQARKLKKKVVGEEWLCAALQFFEESGKATAAPARDDTLVDALKRIEALAKAAGKEGELKLNPPADAETFARLSEISARLPSRLAALLLYCNGGRLFDSLWLPSVEELLEHWGYNRAYPEAYTKAKAYPFGMMDYDMCLRVLEHDRASGECTVWQIDGEAEQINRNGTLEYLLGAVEQMLKDGADKPKDHAQRTRNHWREAQRIHSYPDMAFGGKVWWNCCKIWGPGN